VAIIMSYQGGIDALNILTAAWWLHLRIGLYQSDWNPQNYQPDSAIVPCDFSGYSGLQLVSGWSAPQQVGPQAISNSPEFVWSHDGGPTSNYVFGVYVVNDAGKWVFAEMLDEEGIPMFGGGNVIRYVLPLAAQSIFPSW
jgi:hypothetical protein